jgi:hypothetical protein
MDYAMEWICAAWLPCYAVIWLLDIALDTTSVQFAWWGKKFRHMWMYKGPEGMIVHVPVYVGWHTTQSTTCGGFKFKALSIYGHVYQLKGSGVTELIPN